ncbi:MAG: alpha/beta hydrolase [Phycisphaerae bacterium]
MTAFHPIAALAALTILAGLIGLALAQDARPTTRPSGPRTGDDTSRVNESRPPDTQIVYKKTPQAELKLFAYLPAGWRKSDQRPAIVFFFGGGWRQGTPQQFYSKAEYFASRGLVAFCADYRVKSRQSTNIDSAVEDARSAMRFVRKNAADWGVDPKRLISSGGSSGGHLAACVGTLDGPDAKDDDLTVSCRPQAMVLFNPVLDLSDVGEGKKVPAFVLELVSGDTPADKLKSLKAVSPIEGLRKDCPPCIVFFGTRDALMDQALGFIRKSIELGNRIELWTAAGQPHGFFNGRPWHQATVIKADEFLAGLGFLKGGPTMKPASDTAVLKKALPAPATGAAPAETPAK